MIETALGNFIRQYLADHALKINDLAKLMEVPHTTVARWVRGDTEPSLRHLERLARATNSDICYLVELVIPGERREVPITARDIAERIAKLPKDRQEIIDAMIIGIAAQQSSKHVK